MKAHLPFQRTLREPPTLPEVLKIFHLSIRHLFLINALTLKLCAENDEKETLCGAWDLFKAWGNCFRRCMFFISFMRDACFPSSVACLKVKFNMLPEKLLVNNLISYVLGIMGEKQYLRKLLLYSLRLGRYIASVII